MLRYKIYNNIFYNKIPFFFIILISRNTNYLDHLQVDVQGSCHHTRVFVTQSFAKLIVDMLNLIRCYQVEFIECQNRLTPNDFSTNTRNMIFHVILVLTE